MKSIRLSLMVYFLGLLALALGAASWLVYETAKETLRDKQRAAEKLIASQYNDRRRDEEKRLDNQLLLEAQNIYRLERAQLNRTRISSRDLNALNVAGLAGSAGASDWSTLWLWYGGTTNNYNNPPRPPGFPPRQPNPESRSWFSELYRRYYDDLNRRPPAIPFNEDELMHDENHIAKYFQIDMRQAHEHASWGSGYLSNSLTENDDELPLDPSQFDNDLLFAPVWDDVTLKNSGVKVRRVAFKAPPSGRIYISRPPGSRGEPNRNPPTPPAEAAQRPALYIQCAYDVAEQRDKKVQGFAERREEEMAQLHTESQESLSKLRARLLVMSLTTFAATVAGTWFLVKLGLMPLRRLSVAVSRVSEKDFRLQFNEPRLPSELRPIVERLTGTLEQLKRAFAREKQATADISHELRTPLAALLTTTELALRKPRTAEEYRELLEDCRLSGQQMNRAVERLLALARLDAGVDTMRPERVDVTVLAEQCAALVRPLAEARGLNLSVHGGDGAQLLADPDKLREILTNLLHNAIEYNRPQGSIDVSVARENGHLHVAVRDTGIGISATAREHIFERFYRADSSRGGEDGLHAGLGLAIVKGYVDLMGGTIRVESAEGQGSTFHLELPVDRARSAGEVRNGN
jgi:heavy metal sensor kinase